VAAYTHRALRGQAAKRAVFRGFAGQPVATNVYKENNGLQLKPCGKSLSHLFRKPSLYTAMTGRAHALSRPNPARRWITVLALLAFFLQGLTLQTHVHQPILPAAAAKIQTDGAPKAPLKLDPMDQCRLCQELVHAGVFIAPSAIASPVSLTVVALHVTTFPAFVANPATAFAWQSRAPPRR